jgi:hypothetical protein
LKRFPRCSKTHDLPPSVVPIFMLPNGAETAKETARGRNGGGKKRCRIPFLAPALCHLESPTPSAPGPRVIPLPLSLTISASCRFILFDHPAQSARAEATGFPHISRQTENIFKPTPRQHIHRRRMTQTSLLRAQTCLFGQG